MGIKLSEEGISVAQHARKEKLLTYMKLANLAYVSEPTIKRFISGKPVSLTTFREICHALGLKDWNKLVEKEQVDYKDIPSEAKEEDKNIRGAIAVTGTFSEDKQRQIRATLEMLNKLLLDGDIIITLDGDEETD